MRFGRRAKTALHCIVRVKISRHARPDPPYAPRHTGRAVSSSTPRAEAEAAAS
jgi:hypothetical protein